MKLRKLEEKDAPLMLEWMHDDSVVHDLATDFSKKTLEDCIQFIKEANLQASDLGTVDDLHLAIADEDNNYMGTVSLKHIDRKDFSAEFAITVRKEAMGKGYSQYGMFEIIKSGFERLNLREIYWCVDKKNKRAVRFYDKQNYHEARDISNKIVARYSEIQGLKWYSVVRCNDTK